MGASRSMEAELVEKPPTTTITTGLGLETEIAQDTTVPKPVHKSKLRKKKTVDASQDEFTFIDLDAQRGYFDKTDRNEYNDEDLDVPTFMRRGIKIKIK
jgi:cell division protein FtsZ